MIKWVPALVQSAKFVGRLPDDGRQDFPWLPVHLAAAAIIDFLEVDPTTKFAHVVNSHPVAWSILGKTIAAVGRAWRPGH
ncbi:hypothetical protein DFH07DRAFT_971607 [Mycena maculata]|uniref:Uncharacterized protein n=1 Tax=Mycena maculata TaxID=230809 RepID=A0AAD7MLQ6_9AGAR|nr:hypothetical protein DFH07DRAFT_971607 [Mycena maculata]